VMKDRPKTMSPGSKYRTTTPATPERTSPSRSPGALSPSAKIVSRESQLREVFRKLDLDGSGIISKDVFKSLAVVRSGSSWQKTRTERLMAKVDKDNRNLVTEAEFIQFFSASLAGERDDDFEAKIVEFHKIATKAVFEQVDAEVGTRLQAIFMTVDSDGDGIVQRRDLEPLVPPEMKMSLDDLEEDEQGGISFQALLRLMATCKANLGDENFAASFSKIELSLPLTDAQLLRIQAVFSAFQALQTDGGAQKQVTIDKEVVDSVADGSFGQKLAVEGKLSLEDFTSLCCAIKREKGTAFLEDYLHELEGNCDLNAIQTAQIACIFKALDVDCDDRVSLEELEVLAQGDLFFRGLKVSMAQDLLLAEDEVAEGPLDMKSKVHSSQLGIELSAFTAYFAEMQHKRGVLHVNNKIERFAQHMNVKDNYEKLAAGDPVLSGSGSQSDSKRGCGCAIS